MGTVVTEPGVSSIGDETHSNTVPFLKKSFLKSKISNPHFKYEYETTNLDEAELPNCLQRTIKVTLKIMNCLQMTSCKLLGLGKMPEVLTQYNFRKSVTLGQTHIYTKAAVHSGADKADYLSFSSAVWLVLHSALKKWMKLQNTKFDTK